MDTAHEERMTAARLPGETIVAVLYEQHTRIRDQFDAVAATWGRSGPPPSTRCAS